jgi:predicted nucleotidyltransferase
MSQPSPKTRLEEIAEVLERHGVRYIVIGGQAAGLMGATRPTYDVDLCYERSRPNLERLAAALRELKVSLRGAHADVPFQLDARSLEMGNNFTFSSACGDLDFLGWLDPIGDYSQVAAHAEEVTLGTLRLRTISLDDLIRIKRHIGRPKDLEALAELLAIKRVREEGKRAGSDPS